MSWQQPAPNRQYGAPVVLNVAAASNVKIIVGCVIAGVIGLVTVVSVLLDKVEGGTGARIVGGVIGSICLLAALVPLLTFPITFRPRKLVVEPAGIRWDDPRGKPWALRWQELGAVAISTAEKVTRGTGSGFSTSTTLVRMDLWPRDPGFPTRHPEMQHLWQASGAKGCYRLPLGPNRKFVTPLDAALRGYAPPGLYRGIGDEGLAWGFRYT